MTDAVIVALITLAGTIITVIVSNRNSRTKFENQVATYQAVTSEKLENLNEKFETRMGDLTYEVRKHNGFAERIPTLEAKVDALENKIA